MENNERIQINRIPKFSDIMRIGNEYGIALEGNFETLQLCGIIMALEDKIGKQSDLIKALNTDLGGLTE
ncbi:hypothetical protein [Fulvitalea axinellae]